MRVRGHKGFGYKFWDPGIKGLRILLSIQIRREGPWYALADVT